MNDFAGVMAFKNLVDALRKIANLKARGLPHDHVEAADKTSDLHALVDDLKAILDEEAKPYRNIPDNLVAFVPKGVPRH